MGEDSGWSTNVFAHYMMTMCTEEHSNNTVETDQPSIKLYIPPSRFLLQLGLSLAHPVIPHGPR
jgi:hypothetical protein